MTEREINNSDDIHELIELFQKQNNLHRLDGYKGVENLGKILEAIGYGDKFRTSLETFFADNSGAIEVVLDWIIEQNPEEWREFIKDNVRPCPEEEEDAEKDPV